MEALSHVIWDVKREKDSDYLSGMKIIWAGQEELEKWEHFLDDFSRLKPLLAPRIG